MVTTETPIRQFSLFRRLHFYPAQPTLTDQGNLGTPIKSAIKARLTHNNCKEMMTVHPVIKTVLQRLALGVMTLFFVSLVIFSGVEMLPGDFTQAVLGQAATEETVAAFRRELGLDQPAYMRYFNWIGGVATGDFGTSFSGRASSGVCTGSGDVIEVV